MARTFKLGWVPDLPDHRDFSFSAPQAKLQALPTSVDLRKKIPFAPYDQGRIGSCTANAIAAAVEFDRVNNKQNPDFMPSRLFIYYNERQMEHSIALDNGAQIRDGIKSVNKQGVCTEETWSYDDTPADESTHLFPAGCKEIQKPPQSAYTEAARYKAVSYFRIENNLRRRLSVRLRLQRLHESVGQEGQSGEGSDHARQERRRGGWPRGALRGLQGLEVAVHHPELVGTQGAGRRLLLHAVQLPDGRQPGERLLDNPRHDQRRREGGDDRSARAEEGSPQVGRGACAEEASPQVAHGSPH